MRRMLCLFAVIWLFFTVAATAHAGGRGVAATIHGIDLGQGEGGGGPLYADGTANGSFAISVYDGALVVTIHLDAWFYSDADHIVACGDLTIVKNDLGLNLPPYLCTTPVPVSGYPVGTDVDGDGRADHLEWVRLLH